MAKIDVVIPCYNYAQYLSASVTSVLEQFAHGSAGLLRYVGLKVPD